MNRPRGLFVLVGALLGPTLAGCGPEEEARPEKILTSEVKDLKEKLKQLDEEIERVSAAHALAAGGEKEKLGEELHELQTERKELKRAMKRAKGKRPAETEGDAEEAASGGDEADG
ncbi:MAG: hypothetical protein ACF8XB_10645 [Planctomycetota bacterium JB042]